MVEFAIRNLFWFFVYACIGWCVEVVYAAVKEHRLVNRGFLCGPVCPIYGFGMVALVNCMQLIPRSNADELDAVSVFFVGMLLTTAIELVGGWVLFQIFHIRWWDYSHLKFNIGGYICPQFSVLWGLGSVLMVKVVHPFFTRAAAPLPIKLLLPLDCVLLAFFAADVIVSAAAAAGLNKRLAEIDAMRARLRVTSDKMTAILGTSAMTADTLLDEQKLQLALAKLEGRENAAELRAELIARADEMRAKLKEVDLDHFGTRRLLRAFPQMHSARYDEALAATREAMRRLQKLAGAAKAAAATATDAAKEVAKTAAASARDAAAEAKDKLLK